MSLAVHAACATHILNSMTLSIASRKLSSRKKRDLPIRWPSASRNSTKTCEKSRALTKASKAFKLYDTYGLPLDFITDAVRDLKLTFDEAGFQQRHAGAAHPRARIVERRAQGRRKSCVRETRGNVSHRAGFLFRHDRKRLPHRGHRHQRWRGERTAGRRGRRNHPGSHGVLLRIGRTSFRHRHALEQRAHHAACRCARRVLSQSPD